MTRRAFYIIIDISGNCRTVWRSNSGFEPEYAILDDGIKPATTFLFPNGTSAGSKFIHGYWNEIGNSLFQFIPWV